MMRRVVAQTFMTLDGVLQGPGGPQEDPTGGFTHGGWSVSYWDEVMGSVMGEYMAAPFDLLLGRRTYEIFAAHWPYVDPDDPAAAALNGATKYVATTGAASASWDRTVLLDGDVPAQVAELKEGDGPDLSIQGSSGLIASLLPHRLIDEFRIWTFPVLVGPGKRLFGDTAVGTGLELIESSTSTTGVIMSVYRDAGEVPHGSFALDEPTEAETRRRQSLAAS